MVLTKPNGGKADALNFALANTREEVYIGIDADGDPEVSQQRCRFLTAGLVAGLVTPNVVRVWPETTFARLRRF